MQDRGHSRRKTRLHPRTAARSREKRGAVARREPAKKKHDAAYAMDTASDTAQVTCQIHFQNECGGGTGVFKLEIFLEDSQLVKRLQDRAVDDSG